MQPAVGPKDPNIYWPVCLVNTRYSLSATQNKYRFEYTRYQSDVLRPLILAQLRHAGQTSYAVPAIIDTGSDRCMFDHELADIQFD